VQTRNPKVQAQRGTEMSEVAGQSSTDEFGSNIVDLLVEHAIKLEALEYVLKETNHLVHELYLGAVEDLQARKAAEMKKVLTGGSKSNLSES
jgi:hypothetical protein